MRLIRQTDKCRASHRPNLYGFSGGKNCYLSLSVQRNVRNGRNATNAADVTDATIDCFYPCIAVVFLRPLRLPRTFLRSLCALR